MDYILSDYLMDVLVQSQLQLVHQEGPFFWYKVINGPSIYPPPPLRILYTIRTSGSTGTPKTIHVPKDCIYSNIDRLTEIWKVTSEDVILSCSPPTFDPFVVDVLISAATGAGLLVLNDFSRDFHSSFDELFDKARNGVSLLQITPSIFKSLPRNKMQFLLSRESSLRVLCFGGEAFPEDLMQELMIDDSKEIYNIYGITEISCWSSVRRWQKTTTRMDVGEPLDDEVFEIRDDEGSVVQGKEEEGQLWIGSKKRKCFIDKETYVESGFLFRPTGDVVERIGERIYYKGRSDDIVKIFGVKFNLMEIASMAKKSELGVKDAHCLFDEKRKKIVLFYSVTAGSFEADLRDALADFFKERRQCIPHVIINVPEIPISSHGKVSREQLLELYETGQVGEESLKDLLRGFDLSKSFMANGGTSLKALQMLNSCSERANHPNLIEFLLNPIVSLKELLRSVSILPRETLKVMEHRRGSEKLGQLNWKYNLEKCIDASPTVFHHEERGACVAVGSHSNILVVLSIASGQLLSKITLPDRIESKIVVLGNNLFLGCYDGNMYSINFTRDSFNWTFDSRGMIKSEALLVDNLLVFGNYSENSNLFALNKENGSVIWSKRVGSRGILSRAVLMKGGDRIGVTTLDGTLQIITTDPGETVFSYKLKNPIFTNPIEINNHLIVAEVTGCIHCFNSDLVPLWSLGTGGNIFSPFEVEAMDSSEWNLFFGCYDHCLYNVSLTIEEDGRLAHKLMWKRELSGPIYAKPLLYNEDVICCTTKGSVSSVGKEEGTVNWDHQMGGEIFSSPATHQHYCLVGSRDNFLYCWRLNK